jgi:hypothetical protein
MLLRRQNLVAVIIRKTINSRKEASFEEESLKVEEK